jgi:hypothetical protein
VDADCRLKVTQNALEHLGSGFDPAEELRPLLGEPMNEWLMSSSRSAATASAKWSTASTRWRASLSSTGTHAVSIMTGHCSTCRAKRSA